MRVRLTEIGRQVAARLRVAEAVVAMIDSEEPPEDDPVAVKLYQDRKQRAAAELGDAMRALEAKISA